MSVVHTPTSSSSRAIVNLQREFLANLREDSDLCVTARRWQSMGTALQCAETESVLDPIRKAAACSVSHNIAVIGTTIHDLDCIFAKDTDVLTEALERMILRDCESFFRGPDVLRAYRLTVSLSSRVSEVMDIRLRRFSAKQTIISPLHLPAPLPRKQRLHRTRRYPTLVRLKPLLPLPHPNRKGFPRVRSRDKHKEDLFEPMQPPPPIRLAIPSHQIL